LGEDDKTIELGGDTPETLSFVGTTNEIETLVSTSNTVKIGLPDNVTIGNDLTVTNDLTVSGSIAGSADEMIISADGSETSASGSTSDSLSLNASGGIFTDANVDMDGTLDVEGATSLAATGVLTDVRGTLSVDEAATFDSTITVGSDTNGTDVTMHGTVAGANLLWDASADKLHLSKSYIEMDNSARKDFSKTIGAMGGDVLVSYPKATFEGAEIVLRSTDGTDRTVKKILVTNNTTAASLVVYGTVNSDASTGDIIGDLAVAINGDNVEVKLAAGNSTAAADDVMKGTIDLIKA